MIKIIFFISGLVLSANQVQSQYKSNTPTPDLLQGVFYNAPLQRDYDNFDWNLFMKFNNPKTENILMSPLSIKYSLSILYEAAQHHTQAEIRNVLDTPYNSSQNTDKMVAIREYLKTPQTSDYVLQFGNMMFIDSSITPEQKFGSTFEAYYEGKISKINVNKPKLTADEANLWVRNVTRGSIDSIVTEDDLQDAVILLINTIYFNGSWENQFNLNETRHNTFYLSGSRSVSVPMMTQIDKFEYLESKNLEAKLLKMKFKGDKISMILMLPDSLEGLQDTINRITLKILQKELSRMSLESVAVTVPKFKFEFESHLVPILKSMGLRDVFENTASLSGLARGKELKTRLAVNDVIQKAGIEFNEAGSTIYAATAISLVNKFGEDNDDMLQFTANKPFMFLVHNEETKQILFVGTVDDPTKTKGSLAQHIQPSSPSGKARSSRY